jgi:hypothetical protein
MSERSVPENPIGTDHDDDNGLKDELERLHSSEQALQDELNHCYTFHIRCFQNCIGQWETVRPRPVDPAPPACSTICVR